MEQDKTGGKAAEKVARIALSLRGKTLQGTVVSDRMQKTIIVEFPRVIKSKKYSRFYRRTSRLKARLPEGMKVAIGDRVEISETRRLAKTVNFIVTRKLE